MTGQPDAASRESAARRATGPGLFESLMWVSGYHLAQLIAVVLLIFLLILAAFEGLPPDAWALWQVVDIFQRTNLDWLLIAVTGSATLGALFLILPMAFWRLRPDARKALGTHMPSPRQLVLLAGAVLPLGILSDELYRGSSYLVEQVLALLVERWPILAEWTGHLDTLSLVQQQTASTAYPLLLVIIGLGPAIGEEVVFRGVIGRGLIARRGAVQGVLLTSLLFAMAHMSPAHAIATLPIAIFLHVAYLVTGSIWAPIFVHFLNNALAVTMMKFGLGADVQVSLVLLSSSALYVTVVCALLLEWPLSSRMPSVMLIPADASAPVLAATPAWLLIAAGSGVLCFTGSFVVAATGAGH